MRYLLALLLVCASLVGVAQAAGTRLSVGAGLEILELRGLPGVWGVTEDVARLIQGVAEFGPKSDVGARFAGGFGLLEGQAVSKFEISILANIPLRGARAYFGGGSGLLNFGNHVYPLLQVVSGLKSEAFGILTVFIEAKLLGVLQLSDGPLLGGIPLEFCFGAMF